MITITDIKKLGSTQERRELQKLRDAKQRTAHANKIVNSSQFEKYNAHDVKHYNDAQDNASSDYSKALDAFVAYFQISDNEGCDIANKIRCR